MSIKIIAVLAIFLLAQQPLFAESPELSEGDLQFLEEVQRKAFDYFLKQHHPDTGLVRDKADNFSSDPSDIASIAATGFGLSAMVVGAERGWIPKTEARQYCRKTLRFFLDQMETEHGFFYHFIDWETGKRTHSSELSSIDTALFLAGALTAGEYFKGTEVEALANQLYERVDFPWMLNGGKTLSMGWNPLTREFLKERWQDYNESFILYLLATGSPSNPIPSDSWHQVNKRIGAYGSDVFIYSGPLFTHQYSQIWADLRNKNDGFADYFENSRIATLANRQFCIDHRQGHPAYSENVWGLTASEGPVGYRAYGAEPGGSVHDGTIAPTAAGSSIVFTPELSLKALKFMYQNYKDKIWGKYGFSDAFNLDRRWYSQEVLGIDQGPLLLMIENFRTELLWKYFMRHPSVIHGMERIGFKPGALKLSMPERPRVKILPAKRKIKIDGLLEDWNSSQPALILESSQHRELGEISDSRDLTARVFFAWDRQFLYVAARITDESLVAKRKGGQIWRDDLMELFIDPQGNGFRWKDPRDFQIGLSPGEKGEGPRSWVWPQDVEPVERGFANFKVKKRDRGYDLEAKISWKFLGVKPRLHLSLGLSPAVHDQDRDYSDGKLQWFFLPDGRSGRVLLGEAVLEKEK